VPGSSWEAGGCLPAPMALLCRTDRLCAQKSLSELVSSHSVMGDLPGPGLWAPQHSNWKLSSPKESVCLDAAWTCLYSDVLKTMVAPSLLASACPELQVFSNILRRTEKRPWYVAGAIL
jgi:hypothetical protein